MSAKSPHAKVTLPPIAPPSLEALRITLVQPPALTADELEGRLAAAVLPLARRAPRAPGQLPKPGDEIVWDCVGYSLGHFVPFIARCRDASRLGRWPEFPGMGEALQNVSVGAAAPVKLDLPLTHPLPKFRGQPARLLVELHEAIEVMMPDLRAKQTLAQLDRGSTLEAVFEKLTEEAADDRKAQAWAEARAALLFELTQRTKWKPAATLVEQEVTQRWLQSEAVVLANKSVSVEDQRESLDGWLEAAEVRDRAEQALVTLAMTEALVREGKVAAPPKGHPDPLAFVLDALLTQVTVQSGYGEG